MSEEKWVGPFVARLATEKEETAAETLTRRPADAVTPEADAAGRVPSESLAGDPVLDAARLVEAADGAVLCSLRRKAAGRIPDEALHDLEFLTGMLRRAAAKAR